MAFPQELFTERLHLRGIQDEDLPEIFKGLSHPDVIRYYGVSYNSLEQCKNQLQFYRNITSTNSGHVWAITKKGAGGKMIGVAAFYHWNPSHLKIELGYWLLPEYWNQGFMREVLQTIIPFVWNHRPVHRIEAILEPENQSSSKLLLKLGFEFEGRLRDAEIKHGKFIDLDYYSLLRHPRKQSGQSISDPIGSSS